MLHGCHVRKNKYIYICMCIYDNIYVFRFVCTAECGVSSCYSRTTSINLKSACTESAGASAAGIHYLGFAFLFFTFFSVLMHLLISLVRIHCSQG